MPLKRRLIKARNIRAVVIPPVWLKYYGEKNGQPITNILMELDNVITIFLLRRIKPSRDSNLSENGLDSENEQSKQCE